CRKLTYAYHYVARRGRWTGRDGSATILRRLLASRRPRMIARWLPAAFAAFFAFSAGPGARAQAPAASTPAPAVAPNTAISGEITLVSYAGVFQDNYTASVI